MPTYADMRARIADELANDGDITTAQINYAINDAIKVYQRRPWWFNVRMVTFSTSANGEYYVSTPPATFEDMVSIQSFVVESGGVKSPMTAVDNSEIDFSQDGSVTGVPFSYSRTANKLRFFPIPDAAYTIYLTFVYKMDELVNDDDENAWTDEAEELIRQSAKRRIALNYLQSEELAARFSALEAEAFSAMMAETRRRRPNTTLRVPPMLVPGTFNIITGQ